MLPIPLEDTISRLRASAQAIVQLVAATPLRQARRRPLDGQWSVLEQICHLHDEERHDFRVRLKFILDGARGECPPIDPEGWAVERKYNERNDLQEAAALFMEERRRSLEWLGGLRELDPGKSYAIPHSGLSITAGEILYSWLMHDLLHLRQLADTSARCHAEDARPYSVEYAG